ncbi:sigma-70 family RNA polymerase sigma factor [Tissierella sp. MB52-C2]|uniref:sigma-70 family RNA polymerase sigma factor n=1 Tax=Tissierella sp. MB52-C2 TaxID=3070999 RepID=UPI00280A6D4E|nr:sigma-70 family RNA polymerase sigma factor [Tissierella sp. MB52-C2]WMM23876.1 sigma-70 family RNA polymerase sigma factor [Tissierella sp. MB52-C2]
MYRATLANTLKIEKTKENIYNEQDFSYIFETYYKRVYNFIYYQVSCQYTAEDLTSQTFLKAMININKYSKDKSPFEVWLFAIAKNIVNDHFRNRKKYNIFSIDGVKELISKMKTPEEIIEISETNDELLKALKILDPREKSIISLRFGAELKNKEIAEILDLTPNNVGIILYRIMKKLKIELEKEE